MKKIIHDCDPGHDDAIAILLALKHLDVLGITTVGGNQLLEKVTLNALKVLEVSGMTHIPVFAGHANPLVYNLVTAPQFHGESGLDGPVLPTPRTQPQNQHAVDFIVDTVMSTDDVTLVATGPLTNIAAAINREPRIVQHVPEICLMGGSVSFGNWSPAAEFNIYVDPEAAYRVFNSGIPVKMVGLNLTRELLDKGHEVTLIESRRDRYLKMEEELGHVVQYGDATELWVLERAGIQRAGLVVAVTGDDEDNILICQVARDKYLVESFIARVNNPRNRPYFDLLGIRPAVSATDLILRLIEHEVPEYGLVHLLDLPGESLEVIEIQVSDGAPAVGRKVSELDLPEGSIVISVLRGGGGFVPKADTVIESGDEVLVCLDPGLEDQVTPQFATA